MNETNTQEEAEQIERLFNYSSLLEAKLRLYHLLLKNGNPSNVEKEIMFQLAQDRDVQNFIGEKLRNG